MAWVWITPLVNGAGSVLACGGTAAAAAAARTDASPAQSNGPAALLRLGCRDLSLRSEPLRSARPVSASASATSALASAGLRSVIAATVRLRRGLFEIFGKQVAHDGVARPAAAASHHDADQMAVAAAHRGHEIEARRTGVAGLDAVDALDAAEQVIVVADRLAVVVERGRSRSSGSSAGNGPGWRGRGSTGRARWSPARRRADRRRCDRPSGSCRARAPCGSSAWRNRLRRRRWLRRSRRRRRWRNASPVP